MIQYSCHRIKVYITKKEMNYNMKIIHAKLSLYSSQSGATRIVCTDSEIRRILSIHVVFINIIHNYVNSMIPLNSEVMGYKSRCVDSVEFLMIFGLSSFL